MGIEPPTFRWVGDLLYFLNPCGADGSPHRPYTVSGWSGCSCIWSRFLYIHHLHTEFTDSWQTLLCYLICTQTGGQQKTSCPAWLSKMSSYSIHKIHSWCRSAGELWTVGDSSSCLSPPVGRSDQQWSHSSVTPCAVCAPLGSKHSEALKKIHDKI